jgi:hypothetical protein
MTVFGAMTVAMLLDKWEVCKNIVGKNTDGKTIGQREVMLGKKLNYLDTYRGQRGCPVSASLIMAEPAVGSKWGRNRSFDRSDYRFGVH